MLGLAQPAELVCPSCRLEPVVRERQQRIESVGAVGELAPRAVAEGFARWLDRLSALLVEADL
jgi:hypothetical protein